jgi:valyl-tRNA synthetase
LAAKEIEKAKLGQKQDYPNGIPECGCDALRFALFAYTAPGRDINLDVLRVLGYRHFCNKLWNAFKFALHNLGAEYTPPAFQSKEEQATEYKLTGNESLIDLWILHKLSAACEASETGLSSYMFPGYTTAVFNFWLYEFCDIYLECLKPVFNGEDQQAILTSRNVLYTCLDVALRLTQPLMPFICEELWQRLPRRQGDATPSVCVTKWPTIKKGTWAGAAEVEAESQLAMNIVKTTRSLRADYNLTKAKADLYIRCTDDVTKGIATKFSQYIQKLSYSSNVTI